MKEPPHGFTEKAIVIHEVYADPFHFPPPTAWVTLSRAE